MFCMFLFSIRGKSVMQTQQQQRKTFDRKLKIAAESTKKLFRVFLDSSFDVFYLFNLFMLSLYIFYLLVCLLEKELLLNRQGALKEISNLYF